METSHCKAIDLEGSVKITVAGITHDCDLLELFELIANCETMYPPVKIGDNMYSAPNELKQAIVEALEQKGIVGVTPTGAWQLWQVIPARFNELKKNTSAMLS